MHVETFEKHMNRTCRRCYTIFDFRRDYCCAKGRDECYADLGLVERGIKQDRKMHLKLYRKAKVDINGNIINKKFFRGFLRNECLVFSYRPPGCRSHYCRLWNEYMEKNPQDFVDANLKVVSSKSVFSFLVSEYEYGIRLAYPGGFIIFTDEPKKVKKELTAFLKSLQLPHFITDAEDMKPEDNSRPGVEVIVDEDALIGEPRLFGTLINNNMFMLVRMKMNMGSTGFEHSNIMITSMDPRKIALETQASLKAFHSLVAFQL